MLKRFLAVSMIFVFCVSMLIGCGQNSDASKQETNSNGEATAAGTQNNSAAEKVTIRMSNWLETEESTKEIFKKLMDDFMTANPNIKVETVGVPFAQYKDQVLIACSSGNPADVIMGNSQMMVAFNGAKSLEPLEKLIKSETISDFYGNNLAGTTFNGKIMALPWAPHPNAMFWNKDLFKLAGLDPEKAPATWEEMVAAAAKIAALGKDKDGNQIYGIGYANSKESHAGTVFIGLMYAFGGKFQDESGKVTFDSTATKDAMQYLGDLAAKNIMPTGVEQKSVRSLFASGRLGICFDGDMGRGTFRSISGKGAEFDKSMGVAIIPANKTGRSETVYTEHQLGIAAESKNKEAAAALIEYLVGKEAMLNYHKAYGTLSARKSIAALPEMNEDDYMKVFNKQSETASPLPANNPMFDKACLEIIKGVERVTMNNDDIPTVIGDVQKKIQELYK